jgi:hypothetical protein
MHFKEEGCKNLKGIKISRDRSKWNGLGSKGVTRVLLKNYQF